jgi:hypothetical protein
MPIADIARRRFALVLAAAVVLCLSAFATAPAQAGLPDRLVSLARAELNRGVHEVPNGSNNSRDIARYRTAIRWASGPAPWCGYFVSYVAREAGAPLGESGEGIGLVSEIRRWAKRTGRWRPSTGATSSSSVTPTSASSSAWSAHAGSSRSRATTTTAWPACGAGARRPVATSDSTRLGVRPP